MNSPGYACDEIRQWAERNQARPAEMKLLEPDGDPSLLTFIFDFWDAGRPSIYPITWESFFAQFDVLELSMTFEEQTPVFDIVRVNRPRPGELTH